MFAFTITDSPRLTIKHFGGDSYARYSGSQLVAERWLQTGTLSSDRNKIIWSDGNAWVRTTSGAQSCGLSAAMATRAATPSSPAYRYLSFVTVALRRPYAPIEYFDVWTAMSNSSNVGYTCLSFKNASNVTVTRVLFALSLMDQNGHVVDTGHIDRKGTFSPNVEIHGWHSIAEWSSGQGHHGYKDNCTKWSPDDQAQALAYPHVRSYNLHAERIDYADGTTWSQSESPAP
jgi:hypothetical protein